MLGAMINPEEVGVYSVVLKVTQLVVFILGAVNSVISPEISSLYNIGDKEKLQNIIKKSSQIIIISSSVISLIICIFAPQILSIFGNGFTVGTNAMLITCAGQMINAATGSVGILLSMTGNQKIAAINVFFSAIINIFLNLVLIPRYGINGAAFATFVSTVISNLLNLYWVLKKIKINPTIFSFNPYKNRAN
jgi:O-antigen/teichoic acid export membrane protein